MGKETRPENNSHTKELDDDENNIPQDSIEGTETMIEGTVRVLAHVWEKIQATIESLM